MLVAIGRRPNTEKIGLEKTKVKLNEQGFVVVDEQRRTTDEKIFAIGDVAGPPLLAHKAFREGKVAAEVIKGKPSAFDVQAIPAVIYTDPQVAWCGFEGGAGSKRRTAMLRWSDICGNFRVVRQPWVSQHGVTKMILNPETGRILGVGICGRNAEGMISEGVLAIEMGAVAQDLGLTIHPHPTLSEMMMERQRNFSQAPSAMSCRKSV